jgi:hypothetical protein
LALVPDESGNYRRQQYKGNNLSFFFQGHLKRLVCCSQRHKPSYLMLEQRAAIRRKTHRKRHELEGNRYAALEWMRGGNEKGGRAIDAHAVLASARAWTA